MPTVSASAGASTGSCATDGAVSGAVRNPGLVADCEALLAGRDTRAGTGTLNWSADIPIDRWEGVHVSGTAERVSQVLLDQKDFRGSISAGVGRLVRTRVAATVGSPVERIDSAGTRSAIETGTAASL